MSEKVEKSDTALQAMIEIEAWLRTRENPLVATVKFNEQKLLE